MKVCFNSYHNIAINPHKTNIADENKSASMSDGKHSVGLISRPDLAFHPSFGMVKKSELDGYDLVCANKFKSPLEKFKTPDDFKLWAIEELIKKFQLEQYKQDDWETNQAININLNIWTNYIVRDNFYLQNPALSLIIFDAITNELSPHTYDLPPLFDEKILKKTISQLDEKINNDKNTNFNFNKMYQSNLRLDYLKDEIEKNPTTNFWVKVTSKDHDPDNYAENVQKLRALSKKSWSTKGIYADKYLNKGDFYVYLENNKPRIGVRMDGDKIDEIQGIENNNKIPLKYLDAIKDLIKENHLKGVESEIKKAEKAQKEVNSIRKKFAQDFVDKRYDRILKYLDFKVKINESGMLELSHFKQPENFTFEELGINENDLFKKIQTIKKDADFDGSKVTSLGNIQSIGGKACFYDSKVIDLGKLETVGGDAEFVHSVLADLGNLRLVGGGVSLYDSKLTSLGNIKIIGGDIDFRGSNIKDLGKLETIIGTIKFKYNKEIKSLGNLKFIGGDADFYHSSIRDMGNLEYIGKNADFRSANIMDLNNLKSIGGDAYFGGSMIFDLGNLQIISGNADFTHSAIVSLGDLQYIGGDANFSSKYMELSGNIREIKGDAFVENVKVDKKQLPFLQQE